MHVQTNGGSVLTSSDSLSDYQGVCLLFATDSGTIKVDRTEIQKAIDYTSLASMVDHYAIKTEESEDGEVFLVSWAWVERGSKVAADLSVAGKVVGMLEKITGQDWLGYRIM